MQNEHRTFRTLWFSARWLQPENEGIEPNTLSRCIGATLCLAAAVEGFANDLGMRIAPEAWKDEKAFFSKGEFRGTEGKIRLLCKRIGMPAEFGRRPLQIIGSLLRIRDFLVHPRTDFEITKWNGEIPEIPFPSVLVEITQPGYFPKMLSDIEAFGDQLLAAARERFPLELRGYGLKSFDGPIGGSSGFLPFDLDIAGP